VNAHDKNEVIGIKISHTLPQLQHSTTHTQIQRLSYAKPLPYHPSPRPITLTILLTINRSSRDTQVSFSKTIETPSPSRLAHAEMNTTKYTRTTDATSFLRSLNHPNFRIALSATKREEKNVRCKKTVWCERKRQR
jgi:hypothetical protein